MTYRERQAEATNRVRTVIFAILFCLFVVGSLPAFAAISLHLAANADSTRTTAFPNGDKPVAGCTPPTGYTEVSLGDGGGEFCEQSATEFDLSVFGTSQSQNNHLMHKDGGGADVQVIARITNTYAGSTEANASVGIGIREAATQAAYLFQVHSLQSGATAIQTTYGANGSYTNTNGGAGQSRPRYVCLTYDVSTGDIKSFAGDDGSTWTEVASTNRALSDDEVYIFGASKSATVTLQATVDNFVVGSTIDCYTPGGGGGGGPTLDAQIANQSAAENVAFSLSIASNFSGELTYSTGSTSFPSGSGLSLNLVTGLVSGTPDGDDVAASPYSVDLCGVNLGGTTCDTVQFTVVPVPGDIIPITSANSTVDCDTFESGGRVDPGDVLQIDDGTRGALLIRDCTGTAEAPIIIRNDISGNGPAILRDSNGSQGGDFFECLNCVNVQIDGTGKWVGAPDAGCGIDPDDLSEDKTGCGIQLDNDGNDPLPTKWILFSGTSSDYTIQGVEIDGTGGSGIGGIGISCNDGQTQRTAANEWRENIVIQYNYWHDTGATQGEGLYCGANEGQNEWPMRDVTIQYNLCEDPSRGCIDMKSVFGGTNLVQYNYLYRSGQGGSTTQSIGLAGKGSADITFRANYIEDPGGACILWNQLEDTQASESATTVVFENNIMTGCGQIAGHSNRNGIRLTRNTSAAHITATIRNNTLATSGSDGISCANGVTAGASDGVAINNILSGVGGTAVTGCTSTNNRTGTVASQNFVDAANDDYHLTATSGACNNSTNNAPDTDFDGGVRPLDSADDQGADEAAACP